MMRQLCFALVSLVPLLFLAGCDGDDEEMDSSSGGTTASTGGGSGTSTGGRAGTELEFTDLPGKIRFANFVSDGEQGINLDLYWGTTLEDSEKVGTIEYKEVTEFLVPRRIDFALLDEDQARYFIVREGDVESNPATFLVQNDVTFTEDTVHTVAMAGVEGLGGTFAVSFGTIYDERVVAAPAGMAHVYSWSVPFDQIDDGDFVSVGAESLCDPERAEAPSINAGVAVLIPAGTSGLTLFDVNTEPPCNSGAVPVDAAIEEGENYLLIGEAETYEREARTTMLLKLGSD